jgi:G:T/U-mismatch repair DNA glycosylase
VFFNGTKAEACFKRHVTGEINTGSIEYARLPSTSPANASLSFERKLRAWRMIIGHAALQKDSRRQQA